MATSYLPLYRPADRVTFTAGGAIEAGAPVEISDAWTVVTAAASSAAYVGLAGHAAGEGDDLTVEVGRVIHELIAGEAIAAGDLLTIGSDGEVVKTVEDAPAVFLAVSAASADNPVAALQL